MFCLEKIAPHKLYAEHTMINYVLKPKENAAFQYF